ncbi:hypothetical protein [Methylobacterium soli]|uniref:DUF5648 domain-containing protein n=1 Tax=Methylobacterium soli TaxID=553447 RepID=A0A6L3SST3_9HYPH|nr:hypothetical protein [Methylobacterium soli]KAB1070601.1 hypothetical protein F6X53_29890 [Methylobacterium soli]
MLTYELAGENDSGTIVGNYLTSTYAGEGFINANGVTMPVSFPGSSSTIISGINEDGTIFGSYSLKTDPQGNTHGFVNVGGTFSTVDVPSATSTRLQGVTGGVEFGSYTDASQHTHGFLLSGSMPVTIDVPNAISTSVTGLTSSGEVVGTYTDASNHSHGFTLENGVFQNIDYNGATSTSITGVNDAGQLVGNYTDSTGNHAFVTGALNPVYRFLDTATGDHFYTTNAEEKANVLKTLPTYKYEGVAWSTPDKSANTVDVFRFLDTATGDHFYRTSADEKASILKTLPTYHYEGVAFEAYNTPTANAFGEVTLERFFNTTTGVHHYAADASEAYGINHGTAGPGWVDEGPGFTVHVPTTGMLLL